MSGAFVKSAGTFIPNPTVTAAFIDGAWVPLSTPTEEIVYTIFGSLSDGYVGADPEALVGQTVDTTGDIYVGQQSTGPTAYQGFLEFDTSSVLGTITDVQLMIRGTVDSSTQDFTLEARVHDWGPTLEVADWVAPGDMGSKLIVATLSTVGYNAAGYNTFAVETAFVNQINQAGTTNLVLVSSRQRNGNAPSGTEFVGFSSGDSPGTTQDPQLVITSQVPI
jgi:hypothetical protein